MTLHSANINRDKDGSDGVDVELDGSCDSSITDFADLSDTNPQEKERLRKLNRERVRRYRLRHRKGANNYRKVREAANSRGRIAGKSKLQTSTSSQQYRQQIFPLFILLGIIFLVVLAILRHKGPLSSCGDQDGMPSEY